MFLSADLYTTFLFFELMSLGSYVWVVQEETEGALAAGKTYLTIAVLGGLVTLMGLLLLHHLTGTLVISELRAACAAVENRRADAEPQGIRFPVQGDLQPIKVRMFRLPRRRTQLPPRRSRRCCQAC